MVFKLRDYQRSKVYRSEYAMVDELGYGEMFSGFDEVSEFTKNVLSSDFTKYNFPKTYKRMKEYNFELNVLPFSSYKSVANWTKNYIKLGMKYKNSFSRWIVLHELSHILVPSYNWMPLEYLDNINDDDFVTGHGREFCNGYLKVISEYWSKEASNALKAEFIKRGVKYRGTDHEYFRKSYIKKLKEWESRFGLDRIRESV